jgi:hypothetical protein
VLRELVGVDDLGPLLLLLVLLTAHHDHDLLCLASSLRAHSKTDLVVEVPHRSLRSMMPPWWA